MDPFSQLSQLQQSLKAMTKTVSGLENDMLDILKENTELKVENQLLREKIAKLDKKSENPAGKSQAGLKSLQKSPDKKTESGGFLPPQYPRPLPRADRRQNLSSRRALLLHGPAASNGRW